MMPPKPRQSKNKGKGKGKEAHELKSCDVGTLRYKADCPLNERRGRLWRGTIGSAVEHM